MNQNAYTRAPARGRAALILALVVLGLALIGSHVPPAHADHLEFGVIDLGDSPDAAPGDRRCADSGGTCTLRAAIMETNAHAGRDRITLLPGRVYTLTRVGPDASSNDEIGDLDIKDNLTIVTDGFQSDGRATIAGNTGWNDRIFQVFNGVNFTMEGVTVRNGNTSGAGGTAGGGLRNEGGIVTLDDVVISDNRATSGGGIFNRNGGRITLTRGSIQRNTADDAGGGIFNGELSTSGGGTVTLNATEVSLNSAGDAAAGAGIHNKGSLTLNSGSTVRAHGAGGSGQQAGIFNAASATATISKSEVFENADGGILNSGTMEITETEVLRNSNSDVGGGINNAGRLTLIRSTVADNTARLGGGILNTGSLTMVNSTVSSNRANNAGGGIHTSGTTGSVDLSNVTIANNDGDGDDDGFGNGGGIFMADGTVNLRNTILARNSAPTGPDCFTSVIPSLESVTSQGFNVIQNTTACRLAAAGPVAGSDITGQDPLLGNLADNGGPTRTHTLLAGSPAINRGNPQGCRDAQANALTTDQRGQPRFAGSDGAARCDIGAVEANVAAPSPTPAPPPSLSITDASVTEGNSGTVNAVFTVRLSATPSQTVTVGFRTADGSATSGSDYVAVSSGGPLTFPAGTSTLSQTVTVQVRGDTVVEASETFFVDLLSPQGATIADGRGVGTILDDEPIEPIPGDPDFCVRNPKHPSCAPFAP